MAVADVNKIFESNTGVIGKLETAALAALTQLESLALGTAYAKFTKESIDSIEDLESLDINTLPTVAEVMGTIQAIKADPFPQAPSNDELVKYKKHVWESAQLDSIQTTLMTYISDMGMPSVEFQNALINDSRERKQQILNDSLDIVFAKTSANGFKYANIQTAAGIADLVGKHQFDLDNLDRDITKLMTQWAKDNLQFSIQQGINLEQAHMDFAYKYSSIFREIYTTMITSILEKYRTQVQMEMAKLDAITKASLMRTDVLKANADITSTEAKLKMERTGLLIEQNKTEFQGTIANFADVARLQITAAQTRAQVMGNLIQSTSNGVIGIMKG